MSSWGKCFRGIWKCSGLFLAAFSAAAQPAPFGSEGDLREQLQAARWDYSNVVMAMGGLSLIGAQWRAAAGARLEMVTRPVTMRLSGVLRVGPLGQYAPDIDEPYDLLRLVDFARVNTPRTRPMHVRVGLLDGLQLGIGHVVNYYGTSVAWDDRTVGAEFSYHSRALSVAGFTGNVLLGGVSGGRITAYPLFLARAGMTHTAGFSFSYVTDRTPETDLTAYSADMQLELFTTGGVHFSPFVSYAWYVGYGDGLAFGADLHATTFLDLVSFLLRIGAFYNSPHFIPGYVGALYAVHNQHARTLSASGSNIVGLTLGESRGASDLMTEFKLEVPPGFSMRYYYRRHFGSQALSEFHFRLFVRSAQRLRFEVGVDKLGTAGFLGIFDDFDDQSALVFGADYRFLGMLYLSVLARYSFEQVDDGDGPRYLVQRRFEPFAGVRVQL